MLAIIGTVGNIGAFIKAHRKLVVGGIGIIALIAVISLGITMVQKAGAYNQVQREKDELQTQLNDMNAELKKFNETKEQLEYSEQQVTLLKESTNALKEQVAGLNAEKEELNNKIEELLHIQETVPTITRNELEAQISSLSELVTKKYWYRNATQKSSDKTWLWGWTMPFSDVSLLATYDGVITTSIDLKQVKFNVNDTTKTITVTMPKSKIFDHNIPQETINVLQVRNNLFNSISFNDYNQFISAEKLVMEQEAIDRGLLTEADEEAKEIIETFLKEMPGIGSETGEYKLAFK